MSRANIQIEIDQAHKYTYISVHEMFTIYNLYNRPELNIKNLFIIINHINDPYHLLYYVRYDIVSIN